MLIKRSTGLVLYCKYDPSTGTFKDFSRNKHTITDHNVVPVRGKFGGAGYYNGTNAYLDCGVGDVVSNLAELTVEAWVKWSGGTGVIITEGSQNEDPSRMLDGWMLQVIDGKFRFLEACEGSYGEEHVDSSPITSDIWYHVVATFKGDSIGGLKIFVNGELENSRDTKNKKIGYVIPEDNPRLQIGNRVDTDYPDYFHGTIELVRTYNRALFASEILANYKAKGYYGPLVHAPIKIT